MAAAANNNNNNNWHTADYYLNDDFGADDILAVVGAVQSENLIKDAKNALIAQSRNDLVKNVANAVKHALPGILATTKFLATSPLVNYAGAAAGPTRFIASGVAAVASTTAVGIGLPVVVVCATIAAKVAKMYKDRALLNILINSHFTKLLFFIRNFTVIEQVLKHVQFEYYNLTSREEDEPLAPSPLNVRLNEAFNDAVLKYTTLLHAQLHSEETVSRLGGLWYAFRYVKETVVDTNQKLINEFTTMFHEIESQYLLEVSRFTTLIFFNFDKFYRISGLLKQRPPYNNFALANIIATPIPCTPVEGDTSRCTMNPAELERQYELNMSELRSITEDTDRETAALIEDTLNRPDILAIATQSTGILQAGLKRVETTVAENTEAVVKAAVLQRRANNANGSVSNSNESSTAKSTLSDSTHNEFDSNSNASHLNLSRSLRPTETPSRTSPASSLGSNGARHNGGYTKIRKQKKLNRRTRRNNYK